jgi:diacylglycerol kinase family enzyme
MTQPTTVAGGKPNWLRRVAAAIALAALVTAAIYLAWAVIYRWHGVLISAVPLVVAVIAAWYVLSRRGVVRAVAASVAILALLVSAVVAVTTEGVIVLLVGLALAAVSVGAANFALSPTATANAAERGPNARHPVLLINPRSGGGKAERFALVELCRQKGIEPIVLQPGDDLRQLANDAIAHGADLLGMAGGDGSQALAATVASRHGIPFVVVPAGTRNHFALDLGLDRDDVPGALGAYEDGVDKAVDLAEVNGRVFVNNASMGVYARIVQSTDYRDAKMQTAAAILPDLLGPMAKPLDLRFTLPSGEEAVTARLLLVSNNPYQLPRLGGGGMRERIDGGVLGIAFVRVDTAAEAKRLAALEAAGRTRQFASWNDWTASEFEVRSAGPVEVGVDGEAVTLQPPLHFVSRPRALTVRLPRTASRRPPAARVVRIMATPTLVALWQTLLGRL